MLGAIADDVTGATDLATMLRRSGHRVAVVLEGTERTEVIETVDAVVVALKTRTAPVEEAFDRTLAALELLRRLGARRFYVKYCSTFDSTAEGNIGPTLDAVREALDAPGSVVVPSLPANGRTVYQGHLFVGSELLENSPMRHHPLTPMTKSRVADLLRPQTSQRVGEINHASVAAGPGVLRDVLDAAEETYVVVDAVDDEDLRTIAEATRDDLLVSGGSGLALGIPGPGGVDAAWQAPDPGRRVVLCGSVSSRSLAQIAHAARTQPVHTIDIRTAAVDPAAAAREIVAWIQAQSAPSCPVVCAARARDEVLESDDRFDPAQIVENVLAQVAHHLVVERISSAIVVAGGESSGAVVAALGARTLLIGPEIAPGVCWASAEVDGRPIALGLKSGNFGAEDMFTTAWEAL